MEFCEVTLPFLGRGHPSLAKVVASSGAAAVVDHQVVWKLASGFGKRGRTEAQLTGRIQFSAPKCCDVSGDDKFHTALKVTQPTDSQMSKHDMFCHGLTGVCETEMHYHYCDWFFKTRVCYFISGSVSPRKLDVLAWCAHSRFSNRDAHMHKHACAFFLNRETTCCGRSICT